MAVDRWGKDGEAANAALRGLVTDAKATNAALWGDRVKAKINKDVIVTTNPVH